MSTIINKLGAVNVKDNLDNNLMFDKKHSEFRIMTFISILKAKKDKYMSKYRFEGDKDFTIQKQKVLFHEAFIHGYAGVFDLKKAIRNGLDGKINMEIADNIINSIDSNKVALSVAPSHWDEDNMIVKGHGVTTARHNTGTKSFRVTKDDTAFIKYDEDGYSGWYKWLPYAYLQATGMTVLKKRTATMDKKLVANSANNSYDNTDFDDIYSVATTFLNLAPSQESTLSGNKATEIDIKKILQDKLAKLDFTAQETVNELLSFIDQNRNMWNHMFGERTNVNKKGERNISDEFTSDEVHFALMETDQKEQVQVFADEYNRIFNTNITPIYNIDKTIEKIQEQQRALSGGGADRMNGGQDD